MLLTLGGTASGLLQVGPYPIGVERARGAERPRERRAPLGTGETLRDGMQPRTAPGEPPSHVRDEHPVHRDDPQQVVGRCPGAATHTGPDRTPISRQLIEKADLACAIPARASDRSPVYRVAGQRGSAPGVLVAPA